MNRRLLLALLAVALLVASAGCLAYITGGGEVSDERLDEEPAEPYEWDVDRDAYIEITTDATFRAVYDVSDREEVQLFRRTGYGTEEPLDLRAVRFRYANGTVITGTEFRNRGGGFDQTRDAVHVRLPTDADEGKLAFTADSTPKRFTLPVFVEGSYEVVLPPDRRVDFFLFGNVAPRGYETEVVGDRQHIRWDEVTGDTILVQFYLQRDLQIFAVAVAVLAVIGLGGLYYYRRKIEVLRERREEMGLDVEQEDEDFRDEGPPPGMR